MSEDPCCIHVMDNSPKISKLESAGDGRTDDRSESNHDLMPTASSLDKILAGICVNCLLCRRARWRQPGLAFSLVKNVEVMLCPFCRAYERVHGRKAHEPPSDRPVNPR